MGLRPKTVQRWSQYLSHQLQGKNEGQRAWFYPYDETQLPWIYWRIWSKMGPKIMLLTLRGLGKKKKKKPSPRFSLSLWFRQIDGSELGKECCFCPGCGFGSDEGTQSAVGYRGCLGHVRSDTLVAAPPACACVFNDRSLRKCEYFSGRFCFVTWPSFLGPFPSFEAIVFLTWQMYSGKLTANYLKEQGEWKPTQGWNTEQLIQSKKMLFENEKEIHIHLRESFLPEWN